MRKSKALQNLEKGSREERQVRTKHMLENIFWALANILYPAFGLDLVFTDIKSKFRQDNLGIPTFKDSKFFSDSDSTEDEESDKESKDNIDENDTKSLQSSSSMEQLQDTKFEDLPMLPDIDPSLTKRFVLFLASHPLLSAHYSTKIMSVLIQIGDQVKNISFLREDDLLLGFFETISKVQTRLVESICDGFLTTSALFHHYEDWTYEASSAHTVSASKSMVAESTVSTKLYYRLSKFIIRGLCFVAAAPSISVDFDATAQSPELKRKFDEARIALGELRHDIVEKIRYAFFESQYYFLDGQQMLITKCISELSAEIHIPLDSYGLTNSIAPLAGHSDELVFLKIPQSEVVKTKKLNNRLLDVRSFVVLGNLSYLKEIAVPKMLAVIESKLNLQALSEIKTLYDSMDYMNNLMIQNYIRRKCVAIQNILEVGILFSGLDWGVVGKPQEIRQYCYEVLLQLVLVHASISEVSKPLVRGIMTDMFYNIACKMLLLYRRIDKFSPGGMLQVITIYLRMFMSL